MSGIETILVPVSEYWKVLPSANINGQTWKQAWAEAMLESDRYRTAIIDAIDELDVGEDFPARTTLSDALDKASLKGGVK